MCAGLGQVDSITLEWIKEGDILRERRINARLRIQDAAKRLKMDINILQEMEMGLSKPDLNIYY